MKFVYVKKFVSLFVMLMAVLFTPMLSAAILNVTADYKPALFEASQATFVSTTPCIPSGEAYITNICHGGVSSLDFIMAYLTMPTISRSVSGPASDPKNSYFYYKIPSVKNFSVRSVDGREFPVNFIPRSMGTTNYGHIPSPLANQLYSSIYRGDVIGGCTRQGTTGLGTSTTWSSISFSAYMAPGSVCYSKNVLDNIYSIQNRSMYFGFGIQAPDPLSMPNGVYTGSLILTMGTGNEDISLGNGIYSDNQLVINLTLTVRHQIKVEFPAGYENIFLKPPTGWGEWLNGGRAPSVLKETLPFEIASSSRLRVSYSCQYSIGSACAIKNTRNDHIVPLDLYYVTTSSRWRLPVQLSAPTVPQWFYRAIDFEVSGNNVKTMVKYPGATYTGVVTLVFDAVL